MGCTSSAPKMADSYITDNANDDKKLETLLETKSVKLTRDDIDSGQNQIVLPMCDNLDKSIHSSRNNSSISFSNQQMEDVDPIRNSEQQHENSEHRIEQQNHDEIPSLKEVVNQVILENIFQSSENIPTIQDVEIVSNENVVNDEETNIKQPEISYDEDLKENKEEEENFEESVSPSQSECSRATRWEALADIAAELPASLAVDPLTGQIYSLAK